MDLNPCVPGFVGQSLDYLTGSVDPYYEFFRKNLLYLYIEKKIPLFGICLGFQMLASEFDSELISHLPDHDEGFHSVVANKLDIKVNTSHHQGVTELGPDLIEVAYSTNKEGKKEVCEAFKHRSLPMAAVNIERHFIVI